MNVIKSIKTEKENEEALKVIERLMIKPKLTKSEDDLLELLFVLVENFEKNATPLTNSASSTKTALSPKKKYSVKS